MRVLKRMPTYHSSPLLRRPRSRTRRLAMVGFVVLALVVALAWVVLLTSNIISSSSSTANILRSGQSVNKSGKAMFMRGLVKYLRGKEYLVFHTDNRLARLVESGQIPSNVSMFETSVYGPAIVAMSRWAKENQYAYLLVLAPTRQRHPYKRKQFVSEFWKKPEAMILLQRAARKAGLKGILYVDSDVVPHYVPLSLGVLRRKEETELKALKANGTPIVLPSSINKESRKKSKDVSSTKRGSKNKSRKKDKAKEKKKTVPSIIEKDDDGSALEDDVVVKVPRVSHPRTSETDSVDLDDDDSNDDGEDEAADIEPTSDDEGDDEEESSEVDSVAEGGDDQQDSPVVNEAGDENDDSVEPRRRRLKTLREISATSLDGDVNGDVGDAKHLEGKEDDDDDEDDDDAEISEDDGEDDEEEEETEEGEDATEEEVDEDDEDFGDEDLDEQAERLEKSEEGESSADNAAKMALELDLTALDTCAATNFAKNDTLSSIEQFLAVAAPDPNAYHVILPPGHPTTNAWLGERLNFPPKFKTINAGAIYARTTQGAQDALRQWYLRLIRTHIPLEASAGVFQIVHPSKSHRLKVMRRLYGWMRQFPRRADLEDESVCTPHLSFKHWVNESSGAYRHTGHFRCRGANTTRMLDLWNNTICNSKTAETLFGLRYSSDSPEEEEDLTQNSSKPLPSLARIWCKQAPKFRWHIFHGWPGDQSRLQWAVYLDHIRTGGRAFAVPTSPVLSSMDGRQPIRDRLLYHAGGREAKQRLGMDATKRMMQEDLLRGDGGRSREEIGKMMCNEEWRRDWFAKAWRDLASLPAVQLYPNKGFKGTFDQFEESLWRNRVSIRVFNLP